VSALAAGLFRDRPVEEAVVVRMLSSSPHRGSMMTSVSLGKVALGVAHSEDIPDASVATDGTLAAACSGTVDNRDAIRRVLEAGPPLADAPDAGLLIAAFRHYGTRLPQELRGTYAVAITDGERLWCFRDHLGFRSVFYSDSGAGVFVASEAKQVAAGAGLPLRADREVVERIFWGDYDEIPSAIRGVQRLEAATLLEAGPQSLSLARYWDPSDLLETARLSSDETQEQFDVLMTQAVRRCLTDRAVISLSGGIDSPTVAGYAAPVHEQLFGRPLPALSIVSPNLPSVDETDYIRAVVDRLGLPWHTYEQRVPTGAGLERWGELCDGPVPTVTLNEIEENYTTARQLGFRTILTGEMAEFLMDRPDGLLAHLLARGRRQALIRQIRRERARSRRSFSIARELAATLAPRWLSVRQQRRQRMGWARPSWLDADRVAAGWDRHASAPRHRWRARQLAALKGSGLTTEAGEICEMLCGVRVRRPWVDVDLWEFFLSLPAEVKYEGPLRKSLVRRLARGRVPDVILDRRTKTVFDASIRARLNYQELERWLEQPSSRFPGVDYQLLRSRIESRDLNLVEYRWARDLASAHAFLERYGE
jgi:asparagine synthase (glutamine-hydrolysing)